MNLMDKVRQVGESYELNKYKALNKTIELDASLANERLFATKLRLNQVSSMNDKLNKQLRLLQQQYRSLEQKLLLTETMLRQFIESRENNKTTASTSSIGVGPAGNHLHHKHLQATVAAATSNKQKSQKPPPAPAARSRVKKSASIVSVQDEWTKGNNRKALRESNDASVGDNNIDWNSQAQLAIAGGRPARKGNSCSDQAHLTLTLTPASSLNSTSTLNTQRNKQQLGACKDETTKAEQQNKQQHQQRQQQVGAAASSRAAPDAAKQQQQQQPARQVNSSATQTQTSRTKMIINDLRQRLNLVGYKSEL